MVGHASVARLDPHSYADSEQPVTERIDLALRVDFAQRVLSGEALLTLREASTGPLDLDTRDLRIGAVETPDKKPLRYELAAPERIRIRAGARFTVPGHLRALMAAAPLGRESAGEGEMADLFEMPQQIRPYLLAFAVGDLSPRQLSQRSAVWAERSVADAAAWELDGVE